MVTGRMKTREYEHNGEKRESLDVVAEAVALVPRSQNNPQPRQQAGAADPWTAPGGQSDGWGNGPQDPPF
jgi:single-strand DNA-binding protein